MLCWPIVTCKYGILGQKVPQQGYENWNQTHCLFDKNVEKSIGSVLVKYNKSITYHHISLNTFLCTFLPSRADYYFYQVKSRNMFVKQGVLHNCYYYKLLLLLLLL